MTNLSELFEKCKNAEEVIRVDIEYDNEIYVGNDKLLQKTLFVRGISKQRKVSSSRYIGADLGVRDQNIVTLSFSLQDDKFSSAFYKFCEDIITNSKDVDKDKIIVHTINRWDTWRSMFEKSYSTKLSESQLKGLIGELLFLKNYMINIYGIECAINSWTGPEGNPKDFYIKDLWYEVKTISESRQSVTISSFEQLDSDKEGYLIVNKVQQTSKEAENNFSLNKLVFDIAKEIQDPYLLNVFNQKLESIGYSFNQEYDDSCFIHKKTFFYKVNDNFPLLRREFIPSDILKVSYELSLSSLEEEEVKKWNY